MPGSASFALPWCGFGHVIGKVGRRDVRTPGISRDPTGDGSGPLMVGRSLLSRARRYESDNPTLLTTDAGHLHRRTRALQLVILVNSCASLVRQPKDKG